MRWFIVPGGQVTDAVAAAYSRAPMCSRATADCFPDASRPFDSAAIGAEEALMSVADHEDAQALLDVPAERQRACAASLRGPSKAADTGAT